MWWFQFAAGLIAVPAGVLIIVILRIARWQARMFRESGGWGAERSAKNVTPGAMFIVGAGWIFIGVWSLVAAVNRAIGGA